MNVKVRLKVLLAIISVCLAISCDSGPSQEEIERVIARSEKLTALDKFCLEIPKPDGFTLIKKGLVGNAETTALGYDYRVAISNAKVKDFYKEYLEGPENSSLYKDVEFRDTQIIFRSGKRTVWIEYLGQGNVTHAVTCHESAKDE